jgi:2'-5' RNA ligase
MNSKHYLYFVALVPEDPVQAEIMSFKEYARDHFKSSRSLNSPTHITMIPPFSMALNDEKKLFSDLSISLSRVKKFYIELDGFGHFGTKVIFVNVLENEYLNRLHLRLSAAMLSYLPADQNLNRPFHPHITVAFKDLEREMYDQAWNYYSNKLYQRVTKINSVSLLRFENRKWYIVRQLKLF